MASLYVPANLTDTRSSEVPANVGPDRQTADKASPAPSDKNSAVAKTGPRSTETISGPRLPRWLVDEDFDRQMEEIEEPTVERRPSSKSALVVGSIFIFGWATILLVISMIVNWSAAYSFLFAG